MATKKNSGKRVEDAAAVFAALKPLLARHAPMLSILHDSPDNYHLNTRAACHKGKALFFGAVQIKKNYVSFHLMPIYRKPSLLDGLSPELQKRRQGKACFNFAQVDKALFAELGRLTDAGFEDYRKDDVL